MARSTCSTTPVCRRRIVLEPESDVGNFTGLEYGATVHIGEGLCHPGRMSVVLNGDSDDKG